MDIEQTLAVLKRQEADLVLDAFDEHIGFALGVALRDRSIAEDLQVCIDIHTFEKQIFFWTMPGAQAANRVWTQRKSWVVRNRGRSSYRGLVDNKMERLYGTNWGLDPAVYALSGGAFPIRVKSAGIIGAIATSGLHEREDHMLVVETLCDHLGRRRGDYALPPM